MPLSILATPLLALAAAAPHGGVFPPPPPPPPPPGKGTGIGIPGPGLSGGQPRGVPPSSGGSTPATPPRTPGAPTSPTGAATPRDLFHWSHWWHLERDLYLWSPERLRRPPLTGEEGKAAGVGRPTDADAATVVLPEVLALLDTSRHDDVITACLIAAARVGSRMPVPTRGPLVEALVARLDHPSLEVAETAAVSLGILGDERCLVPLLELVAASEAAAKLTGRGTVPERVRAFAAYGLGLMASQEEASLDAGGRQRAALALMDIVAEPEGAEDLTVASVISLGLMDLPLALHVPPAPARSHRFAQSVVHRGALARWMVEHLVERPSKAMGLRATAHGSVALARVGRGVDGVLRGTVIDALLARAKAKGVDQRTRAATWIALGEILTAGEEDEAARVALARTLQKGQPLERRFAAMSLAWAGSRPGLGEEPFAGAEHARKQLERRLSKGTEQDRTWSALALGVQSHALAEQGVADAGAPAAALRNLIRGNGNASTVGAFSIAAALAHVHQPEGDARKVIDAVRVAVERTADPSSRGHVAIALGVMGAHGAAEPLEEIFSTSTFQPEPLWSAAVSLSLIGNTEVTPRLMGVLAGAKSGVSRAAAAAALGRVGDRRALDPLLALMKDEGQISSARAFAVVGLGVLCDEDPRPWRVPIAHALPYVSAVSTLWGDGRGVLDIL